METQIPKACVERLAGMLGFDNGYVVNSFGLSGVLWIFWHNGNMLMFLVTPSMTSMPLFMLRGRMIGDSCVYGEAQTSERFRMGDLLKSLASASPNMRFL